MTITDEVKKPEVAAAVGAAGALVAAMFIPAAAILAAAGATVAGIYAYNKHAGKKNNEDNNTAGAETVDNNQEK